MGRGCRSTLKVFKAQLLNWRNARLYCAAQRCYPHTTAQKCRSSLCSLAAGQKKDIVDGAVMYLLLSAPALYCYVIAECLKRYLLAQACTIPTHSPQPLSTMSMIEISCQVHPRSRISDGKGCPYAGFVTLQECHYLLVPSECVSFTSCNVSTVILLTARAGFEKICLWKCQWMSICWPRVL